MEHRIDATRYHHRWDRTLEPTLSIASGDEVQLALQMTGAEQIREGDRHEDTSFDDDTLYRLLGPIFVQDARPGDTLRVDILSLEPGDWGWSRRGARARPAARGLPRAVRADVRPT